MPKRKGDKNIDDKTKKMIQATYVELQNYSKVAEIFKIDDETVRQIVLKDKTNILELIEKKKEENTQSVLDYMDSQAELKKAILYNSLIKLSKKIENNDISANDLTRIYGVIMDKELISFANKKTPSETNTKITIVNSLPKDDENE